MEAVKAIYGEKLIQPVSGKRILITGGTTGIGRATAHLLARDNRVLIVGRHQQELDEALEDFRTLGAPAANLQGKIADVSKQDDIDTLFGYVDETFNQLDILINNAALPFDSILTGSYNDWEYVIRTNLLGYLACSRQAVDRMKSHGA